MFGLQSICLSFFFAKPIWIRQKIDRVVEIPNASQFQARLTLFVLENFHFFPDYFSFLLLGNDDFLLFPLRRSSCSAVGALFRESILGKIMKDNSAVVIDV